MQQLEMKIFIHPCWWSGCRVADNPSICSMPNANIEKLRQSALNSVIIILFCIALFIRIFSIDIVVCIVEHIFSIRNEQLMNPSAIFNCRLLLALKRNRNLKHKIHRIQSQHLQAIFSIGQVYSFWNNCHVSCVCHTI